MNTDDIGIALFQQSATALEDESDDVVSSAKEVEDGSGEGADATEQSQAQRRTRNRMEVDRGRLKFFRKRETAKR